MVYIRLCGLRCSDEALCSVVTVGSRERYALERRGIKVEARQNEMKTGVRLKMQ